MGEMMNKGLQKYYKEEMDKILRFGGTKEEQLNAFIQLVEEILEA